MKNKKLWVIIAIAAAVVLAAGGILIGVLSNPGAEDTSGYQIVVEGEFSDGSVIEYTGQKVQFPVAHVADGNGKIQSYAVQYKVVNLGDKSEKTDEYATFELKTGKYQLIYTYTNDPAIFTE